MKKAFLILLTFLITQAVSAQAYKIYTDGNGQQIDSSKANSYIIYRKLSDSAWLFKQYDMRDTIKITGTFKDLNFSIPHGRFVYYYKISAKGTKAPIPDTLNHIKTIGYYVNGVKAGPWTDYFSNGNIERINTFDHDKLNGPFVSYSYDTNTILVKGNYVDGLKQGEWYLFDIRGNIVQTDIFKNNELIKSVSVPSPYKAPVAPNAFYTYIKKGLISLIQPETKGKIIVVCKITAEGKLENAHVVGPGITSEIDNKLIQLIPNSPLWKPAYHKTLKHNIPDSISFMVLINGGTVELKQTTYAQDKFYQLTH
jgi:antitoxin component YwqK of YwqJK toxin-antitoxin module